MEPVVKSLILKRFRSIQADQVEFDNPTFLVGRNGSGKSNLVDAFAFLSDAMTQPLQAAFDKRGGIEAVRNRTSVKSAPPNLGLCAVFGSLNGEISSGRYAFEIRALPNYGFEVVREQCLVRSADKKTYWFDRAKKKFESNLRGLEPALDPSSLGLPLIGGERRLAPVLRTLSSMRVYSIEPAKLREMQDPDVGTSLRSDAGNAASVLKEIERQAPADVERIGQILEGITPNTKRVRTKKHGKKLSLEFTQEWGPKKRLRFEAFNMSDGTLRALGILTAVYQRPAPSVMVIEEPEATIHPGALGAILDLLRYASRKLQIVVTTHSPEVLDAKWIEARHLRVVTWYEGATRVTNVSDSAKQALQTHLMGAGELLRSDALEPPPLFQDVAGQLNLFEQVA